MGLVPATSPCNKSQGLVASCELATSPCEKSQGPVPSCVPTFIPNCTRNNLITYTNFQESCSISGKAKYSTENFTNLHNENQTKRKFWVRDRLKFGWASWSGCLLFRRSWEMLFHSSLEIFKPGTFALRWKIPIWTFENCHWRMQHDFL